MRKERTGEHARFASPNQARDAVFDIALRDTTNGRMRARLLQIRQHKTAEKRRRMRSQLSTAHLAFLSHVPLSTKAGRRLGRGMHASKPAPVHDCMPETSQQNSTKVLESENGGCTLTPRVRIVCIANSTAIVEDLKLQIEMEAVMNGQMKALREKRTLHNNATMWPYIRVILSA